MKMGAVGAVRFAIIVAIAVMLLSTACTKMSESVTDNSVGFNGSFEYVKSGLPVNWLIYSPKTIPSGNYELIIDTTEYKDGKQSLQFMVNECTSTGGWHSPGFCNEFDAAKGEPYVISFWAKNEGSRFRALVGGVTAFEGEYDTIVNSGETFQEWRLFEYEYEMPAEMDRIRFELNVLKPGAFWIDDLKIEREGASDDR